MRDYQDQMRQTPGQLGAERARRDREAEQGLVSSRADPLAEYQKAYSREWWRFALTRPTLPALPTLPRSQIAGGATALAALLLVVLAPLAYVVLHLGDIRAMVELAEDRLACTQVTALEATDGSIIATIPVLGKAVCPDRPFLTVPMPQDLVDGLAPKLATIEGAWQTSGTIFGHDPRGVPRWLYGQLQSGNRGVSGPLLTAFEYAIGKTGGLGIRDKLLSVVAASAFVRRNLSNDALRARFLVDNMPVMIGRGYPMAGRLGAQALFGRLPQTLVEGCIYARAMGYQLLLPRDGAALTGRMARDWARVIGPGAVQCVNAHATSDTEREAALDRLQTLCGDSALCMQPGLEPDPERRLVAYMAAARASLPAEADPGRIAIAAMRPVLDALKLTDAYAVRARVPTTLVRTGQQALDNAAPELLADLEHRLAPGACLSRRDCDIPVRYHVAGVEILSGDAALRASLASEHGLFFGPVARRGVGFVSLPPDWGMASTGKMLLALVAPRHGMERLCTNPAGGESCRDGEWLSVNRAIAISDNGTAEWLASRYWAELWGLMDATGFSASARPMTARDFALGIGRLAAPERYVAFLAALFSDAGVSGGVRVSDHAPLGEVNLSALGYDAETRQRARAILAGPVRSGGTLAALVAAVRVGECRALAGKSGTHSAGDVTVVKASTIVWQCGPKRSITQVRLSTEDGSRSLGQVNHADLAALHQAALAASLHEGV